MRRPIMLFAAGLLVTGCQIEPTPSEYIDQVPIAEQDVGASEAEITARLRLTGPALERGNLNSLLTALAPSTDLEGWGPASDEPIQDASELTFALAELTAGMEVDVGDVVVRMSPRNTEAWFTVRYDLSGQDEEFAMRLSGIFLRQQGDWRLVQAHISRATPPASPPEGEEADGTPAAGG